MRPRVTPLLRLEHADAGAAGLEGAGRVGRLVLDEDACALARAGATRARPRSGASARGAACRRPWSRAGSRSSLRAYSRCRPSSARSRRRRGSTLEVVEVDPEARLHDLVLAGHDGRVAAISFTSALPEPDEQQLRHGRAEAVGVAQGLTLISRPDGCVRPMSVLIRDLLADLARPHQEAGNVQYVRSIAQCHRAGRRRRCAGVRTDRLDLDPGAPGDAHGAQTRRL